MKERSVAGKSILLWGSQEGKYQNGDDGFLGKWRVASVIWDSLQSKDSIAPYLSLIFLPGIKSHLGRFKTMSKGKQECEKAVRYWLKESKSDGHRKTV